MIGVTAAASVEALALFNYIRVWGYIILQLQEGNHLGMSLFHLQKGCLAHYSYKDRKEIFLSLEAGHLEPV